MFSLVISLCISGSCYVSEPMEFHTMKDCGKALIELRDTKQLKYNRMYCKENDSVKPVKKST